MMFVSLAQARTRLRFDAEDSASDADLSIMISGASREIFNYIKSSSPDFFDSAGQPIEDAAGISAVPDDVQDATLLYVAIKFRNRDQDGEVEQEHGFMPRSVLSILYPYRLPALA